MGVQYPVAKEMTVERKRMIVGVFVRMIARVMIAVVLALLKVLRKNNY